MRSRSSTSNLRRALVVAAVAWAIQGAAPVSAVGDPPLEQDPGATVPVVDDTTAPVASTLPPGCESPEPAQAVFVGEVTAKDVRTARFEVVQIRAGSLKGYQVTGLVDVDFFDDVRYLEVGEQYIVGAGRDGITDRLVSTVREPAPLFGGNQVVGVNDSDVDCPDIEVPVRTLTLDGESVESGVIAPLLDDSDGVMRAILLPALWVFLVLLGVAAVKNLLWTSGREVKRMIHRRDPERPRAPRRSQSERQRRHGQVASARRR